MKLTLNATEFADLVACFLYSQVTNPDESVPVALSKEWAEFVQVMNRKGMRSILLQYYLGTNPQIRVRWNMIRKTFMDVSGSNPSYIEIRNQKMPVKEKDISLINKVGRVIKGAIKIGAAGALGMMEDKKNNFDKGET